MGEKPSASYLGQLVALRKAQSEGLCPAICSGKKHLRKGASHKEVCLPRETTGLPYVQEKIVPQKTNNYPRQTLKNLSGIIVFL